MSISDYFSRPAAAAGRLDHSPAITPFATPSQVDFLADLRLPQVEKNGKFLQNN